jgi:hypothetical protein
MKKILFLLALGMFTTCQGQEQKKTIFTQLVTPKKDTTMIEKFDFDIYEKTHKGSDKYILTNGNTIFSMVFFKDKVGFQRERLPAPSFLTIYKEFYPNGYLKRKETHIGEYVKVGISRYYDEQGNLIKEADENQKFGKIKPQQMLEFLQEKGYVNLKTGEGRIDKEGHSVFNLRFGEQNKEKYWIITIVKGIPNTDPRNFPEFGEPPAYLPLHYVMDGETGEVTIEGEEDKKTSGVYKTYKGKSYTQQEWEEFEQKLFEEYAGKHNISLTKNDHTNNKGFTSRFLPDD